MDFNASHKRAFQCFILLKLVEWDWSRLKKGGRLYQFRTCWTDERGGKVMFLAHPMGVKGAAMRQQQDTKDNADT
jgi:hypothetical protein